MKLSLRSHQTAFTLMELLVVISIIAILAGIAGPGLRTAMVNGKVAQATQNARQIAIGLRAYGGDNDGRFPDKETYNSANDAYRELVPNYLDTESIFAVGSSPVAKKADNRVEPETRVLEKGENHWAYVQGLDTSSNSQWPLVVDHTDGSGHYTNKESDVGGTWGGTKAIMIRCDTSAIAVSLKGTGSKRYIPRYDDPEKNALEVSDYIGEKARLLEPLK